MAALGASLDALGNTVTGLTDPNSVKAAKSELTAELAAVGASWTALKRQLDERCP